MDRFRCFIAKSFVALLMIVLPVVSQAQPMFQITKVKSWDTLNLRSEPGVKSKVIVKIPANGNSISLLGGKVVLGSTTWVKISWKEKQGWVSQYFLQPMAAKPEKVKPVPSQQQSKQAPISVKNTVKSTPNIVDKGVGRNQWILRCGNTSPFWRVDVYPKALKLFAGKYKSLLPLTYKKQDKNKWNTAIKTHLKGATSKDKIDLTIGYSHSRCNDTISKKKVPYSAVVKHNDKKMKGCCMAIKIN
ncbi:MAG: SH3 domain-containing protein [Cocleimonas sp.]|nr:SH3 domain-containing protein [Cocleimonas sp.]